MSEQNPCLFCHENAIYKSRDPLNMSWRVDCPNCGTYRISDILKQYDIDTHKIYAPYKYLISGLIREKNDFKLLIEMITTDNLDSLLSDPLIPNTIMQKLDKILIRFHKHTKSIGAPVSHTFLHHYAIGYAKNANEYSHMIQYLVELGYLSHDLILTLKGLERIESLLTTNVLSNKVFVAMGFKTDLLKAHKEAIVPACHQCGYDAILIIDKEHNDDITDRIIAEIKTSKFVITDFTYNNQGAYFEAGFAQGHGLPVIRTCKKDWFEEKDENDNLKNHLHFDINHYNFILWENHEDLKEKLINRIRATIM